jgi:outer membrane protein assembly factor BamB
MGRTRRALVAICALLLDFGLATSAIAAPAPGEQLWVARYNGPSYAADEATAMVLSSDGSTVFVTGSSQHTGHGYDYVTVAYAAATGAELWQTRFDGPAETDDLATDITVSADGTHVFVTGASSHKVHGFDYATVAYESDTGVQLWVKRYDGPAGGDDHANAIVASPDGATVFVTGKSPQRHHGDDYATVAYAADTGTQKWVRRYDVAGGADEADAIAVSKRGGTVFVTGGSGTIAYAVRSGDTRWTTSVPGADIAVSPTGPTIVLTATIIEHQIDPDEGKGYVYDYGTAAVDARTGDQLWSARYDGPAGYNESDDRPSAVAMSPDGHTAFVTGTSVRGGSSTDYATIAYSTDTGAELWVSRHLDGGALDLAVAPDGSSLFVTGYVARVDESHGTISWDYGTIAYDPATGAEDWLGLYDPTDDDAADAVRVSPDGATVFVTGYSITERSSRDYATVAYAAP